MVLKKAAASRLSKAGHKADQRIFAKSPRGTVTVFHKMLRGQKFDIAKAQEIKERFGFEDLFVFHGTAFTAIYE